MFSLASLGTIIACVFLLGTFLSVALNVRSTMQQMEQSVGISVFFEQGISTERKDQIGEEIKKKELPIGCTVTNEQSINCIKYDLTNDELVNLAKKKLSIISERELEGYEIVNTNITYDIKNDECTMTGAYVIK